MSRMFHCESDWTESGDLFFSRSNGSRPIFSPHSRRQYALATVIPLMIEPIIPTMP
jgi:hypothetical protein